MQVNTSKTKQGEKVKKGDRSRLSLTGKTAVNQMEGRIGLAIHGSTGSIGTQTLDVVKRLRGKLDFEVVALVCNSSIDLLERQILEHDPKYAVVVDEAKAESLRGRLTGRTTRTEILGGERNGIEVCGKDEVAEVVIATAGFAGLAPTLHAIEKGKRIKTANKETFLAAGKLVMDMAREHGVEVLPMDSEPSAMWQCLEPEIRANGQVRSVIWDMQRGAKHQIEHFMLTGSGGPFLNTELASMQRVTPEQALRHPTWDMGSLITIRSATMMNKGMERIEVSAIFGVPMDMVKIVIHPQSIVHSGVVLSDGSMKVQQGPHDMRYPIQYAMAFPERYDTGLPRLDLASAERFDFREPDSIRFPSLALAEFAGKKGGTAPAVLNGADEVAVSAFLQRKIGFSEMTSITEKVVYEHCAYHHTQDPGLEQILKADRWAREQAGELVALRTANGRRIRV